MNIDDSSLKESWFDYNTVTKHARYEDATSKHKHISIGEWEAALSLYMINKNGVRVPYYNI